MNKAVDINYVYELSYNDILEFPSPICQFFLNEFLKICKDIPSEIYDENTKLGDMLLKLELYEDNLVSEYVFPGEKVIFYPNIKYRKVLKKFTCSVSSQIVGVGDEALLYKPLLYLPQTKETYVLQKGIKAHYSYSDFFPLDIKSFDDFCYKVTNAYHLNLDEYYSFSCNIGGDLTLRKLKR